MKRYQENGPAYCRLTYVPEEATKPVSVWAEVGPVTDGIVQSLYAVDEHGERFAPLYLILVGVGEFSDGAVMKPAKLNLRTGKLERARK